MIEEKGKTHREREIVTIDEKRARIDILGKSDERTADTAFLMTLDGGKTWLLRYAGKPVCGQADSRDMFRAVGSKLKTLGRLASANIRDPSVSKTLDQPGPDILGHPTRHVRLHSTMKGSAQLAFAKWEYEVEMVEDLWFAEDIPVHPIERAWFDALSDIGIAQLDSLFEQLGQHSTGMLLRRNAAYTLKDLRENKTERSSELYEVVSIEEIPADQLSPETFRPMACEQLSSKKLIDAAKDMVDYAF